MPDAKNKKKLSPSELLAALHDMARDDERADEAERIAKLSDAEVAAEIRALGGDPDAIGARGAAFVERLVKANETREAWKDAAKASVEKAKAAMARAPKTPADLPRAEL